jgi:hypothetical protein
MPQNVFKDFQDGFPMSSQAEAIDNDENYYGVVKSLGLSSLIESDHQSILNSNTISSDIDDFVLLQRDFISSLLNKPLNHNT